jgi:leucyl aminopeptidase
VEPDVASADYDCLVLVTSGSAKLTGKLSMVQVVVDAYRKVDRSADQPGAKLVPAANLPYGKLVYSPTGPINRDYDDVRRFEDAGKAAAKCAIKSGSAKLLVAIAPCETYENAQLVSLLGVLDALYVSAEARQGGIKPSAVKVGVFMEDAAKCGTLVDVASALEAGRTVARDITMGSPTFMTPPDAATYVFGMLERSPHVKIDIIKDQKLIESNYPIMAAVNRAVNKVPEFESRLVKLTYTGEGPIKKTLMFVGKGVTFDSGGIDVKVGGAMIGMSHDKGGAAAVAGFFKVLTVLNPKGLKVMASLPFVRNGIGPEGVTCDEIIRARSGKRLRIINTDAEGRMIMVDPLCEMVEKAVDEVNPHVFTVATLTGHAVIAAGPGYALAMDNGPAAADRSAQKLKEAGEKVANPIELSTIRREDYHFHYTLSAEEDLLQSYSRPSTQTPRGHQIPAAFLILGSRLDQHGKDSDRPIPYTHIDIAAAEEGDRTGSVAPKTTGSPILALAARYVLEC